MLGVGRGSVLEVHSSLKSLGWVEGGAATVINALLAVVGQEGAIVMSAYPISKPRPLTEDDKAMGITYKAEILPEDSSEPTNLGAVVDEFKRFPDVVLGKGIHRGAAWGRDAHLHCMNYKHLVRTGGQVLLIGVGIHRCSSMHIPEGIVGIPSEILLPAKLPADVREAYPDERWYVECDRAPGPPGDAWGVVWQEALSAGLVTTGRVCNAECHLFKARDVIAIYEKRLRTDPWGLFGAKKPA